MATYYCGPCNRAAYLARLEREAGEWPEPVRACTDCLAKARAEYAGGGHQDRINPGNVEAILDASVDPQACSAMERGEAVRQLLVQACEITGFGMITRHEAEGFAPKLLRAGLHPEQIARRCGTNRSTVYAWLRKIRQGQVSNRRDLATGTSPASRS